MLVGLTKTFDDIIAGYIGEFEVVDDHRSGKIVVNLTGRLNKVSLCHTTMHTNMHASLSSSSSIP